MPVDFGSGSAASVDLGDGGAHDPQIRFTADDESCMWNAFPVCIDVEQAGVYVPGALAETRQLSQFVTTAGGFPSAPSEAQWPGIKIYDYISALNAGYRLQVRFRFTATSGGTSVGSVGSQIDEGSCSPGQPGPILGVYDSGFNTVGCIACNVATHEYQNLVIVFTNFSPVSGSAIVNDGIFNAQWVLTTTPVLYRPLQHFSIEYRPPCSPNEGLFITLETDSCGLLTKTYQNVADAVNALNIPITATILGAHGADLAKPDPSCFAPDYCCDMTGATCTGASDN